MLDNPGKATLALTWFTVCVRTELKKKWEDMASNII